MLATAACCAADGAPATCLPHQILPIPACPFCSFSSEAEDPLLWASTYEAGLHLQAPVNAAQAQQPRQPQAAPASSALPTHQLPYHQLLTSGSSTADPRKAAIRGYKAQSARVLEHVDRLLAGCEARRQSLVVEGVHLSLSMVVRMMQRHPSVVPFLVHISNEAKHMERFAVRSKVMTLRPDGEAGRGALQPVGRQDDAWECFGLALAERRACYHESRSDSQLRGGYAAFCSHLVRVWPP